jgi:phosphoserine phosphatase RsbU/P
VLSRMRSDPAEILSILAETMEPDLDGGRFLTCLIVALDPRTHRLEWSNAGHGPALLFRRESRTFQPLASTSLPLGFLTDFTPRRADSLQMAPGDLLVLATDGLIELQNSRQELFGRAHLEAILCEHCTLPAPELVMVLQDEVAEFLGDNNPQDDVTLMLIERKLDGEATPPP